MKAPGYLVGERVEGGALTFGLRLWHPSFWPIFWGSAFRALRRTGSLWSPTAWATCVYMFCALIWASARTQT